MECVRCGLRPADIPQPADDLFETCSCCGEDFCQACLFEHEASMAEVCS